MVKNIESGIRKTCDHILVPLLHSFVTLCKLIDFSLSFIITTTNNIVCTSEKGCDNSVGLCTLSI